MNDKGKKNFVRKVYRLMRMATVSKKKKVCYMELFYMFCV